MNKNKTVHFAIFVNPDSPCFLRVARLTQPYGKRVGKRLVETAQLSTCYYAIVQSTEKCCPSCGLFNVPCNSTYGSVDEPPTVSQRSTGVVDRLGELEQPRFHALDVQGQQKSPLKVEEVQHPVEGLADTRLAHPEDQTHVLQAGWEGHPVQEYAQSLSSGHHESAVGSNERRDQQQLQHQHDLRRTTAAAAAPKI